MIRGQICNKIKKKYKKNLYFCQVSDSWSSLEVYCCIHRRPQCIVEQRRKNEIVEVNFSNCDSSNLAEPKLIYCDFKYSNFTTSMQNWFLRDLFKVFGVAYKMSNTVAKFVLNDTKVTDVKTKMIIIQLLLLTSLSHCII